QAQRGIKLKGRSQGPTLLLSLWSTHKKRPSMTEHWKNQQASKRFRCRYLQPRNGQKQLTPVVELGKAERR
ncbi:mCG145919, partial [Mus musculus]